MPEERRGRGRGGEEKEGSPRLIPGLH